MSTHPKCILAYDNKLFFDSFNRTQIRMTRYYFHSFHRKKKSRKYIYRTLTVRVSREWGAGVTGSSARKGTSLKTPERRKETVTLQRQSNLETAAFPCKKDEERETLRLCVHTGLSFSDCVSPGNPWISREMYLSSCPHTTGRGPILPHGVLYKSYIIHTSPGYS